MQFGDLAVLIGSMCAVMATFAGILATVLIRMIKASERSMTQRFDGQDKQLERMAGNLFGMAGELGEVKGELKRIAPIERARAD